MCCSKHAERQKKETGSKKRGSHNLMNTYSMWLHSVHHWWNTFESTLRSLGPVLGVSRTNVWMHETQGRRDKPQTVKVEEEKVSRITDVIQVTQQWSELEHGTEQERKAMREEKKLEAEMTNRAHRCCWRQWERKSRKLRDWRTQVRIHSQSPTFSASNRPYRKRKDKKKKHWKRRHSKAAETAGYRREK